MRKVASQLRELNDNSRWREILGKQTLDRHQKDIELILRVFALSTRLEKYEKPMKEFLNQTMLAEKKGNSSAAQTFARDFPRVCELIVSKLGQRPFHLRGPLNASALDSVMSVLLTNLKSVPADLSDRYSQLKQDKDFNDATYYGTSDVAVLKTRFQRAKDLLIG